MSCLSSFQNGQNCACGISWWLIHHKLMPLDIDLTSLLDGWTPFFQNISPHLDGIAGELCWTPLSKISQSCSAGFSFHDCIHQHIWLTSFSYFHSVTLLVLYGGVCFLCFSSSLFLTLIICHQWLSLTQHNIFAEFVRLAQTLTFMGSQWLPPEVSAIVTNT